MVPIRRFQVLALVLLSLALVAFYRSAIYTPSPLMNQAVIEQPQSN